MSIHVSAVWLECAAGTKHLTNAWDNLQPKTCQQTFKVPYLWNQINYIIDLCKSDYIWCIVNKVKVIVIEGEVILLFVGV